jgi:intracellular septation protein
MDKIFVNTSAGYFALPSLIIPYATLWHMSRSAYIQLFCEFFPVVAFFAAGQFFSFYSAAAILVFTTLLALLVSLVSFGKLPVMPLFSGVIVLFFGGLTLVSDQPEYLIFADTFYYFSLAFLILIFYLKKKNLVEYMFNHTFAMKKEGWEILARRWFIVLFLAGTANEVARYFLEPEVWIDYRFFKVLVLMAFSTYQFTLSKKYRIPEESNGLGLRIHE